MSDVEEVVHRTVWYPRGATVFAAVCSLVFIVVGLTGNLVTMLALARCAKLRNATTAFVISLCTADLLFCAINLPLTASRFIHEDWLLGDTLCELFPFFFYGNVAASLMSMTAITINRYILINHYHLYDRIYTRRYIGLMILLYWAFSFSIMVPPLVGVWGQLGFHKETFSCTILDLNGKSPKKFLFVLGFLLPCVVIIASYSCIFYKVHRSRRNIVAHSPPSSPNSTNPSTGSGLRGDELRLTRLMLVIFLSFLVCFLPLMIVNVFDSQMRYPTIHVVASIFAWMSSCINPIIYAAINRQYRQAYVKLLCPKRRNSCVSTTNKSSTASSKSGTSCCTGSGNSRTIVLDIFSFGNGKPCNGSKQIPVNNKEQHLLDEVAL